MRSSIKNFFIHMGVFFVPIISILLLELLFYIPRSNYFWNFFRLTPFYIGIYFWLNLRADIFNIVSAFILGIFADVLSSSNLGINVMTFLVLYIISTQILFYFNIKKFSYSWILFSLALLITLLFKAIIVSIIYQSIIPINYLLIELGITIILYPILTKIYSSIEKRYIHLEDNYEKI